MSVHLFANADEEKTEHIGKLLEKLFEDSPNREKIDKLVEHITFAHICSITEAILESSELRNLHTFDPELVTEIEATLLECR